jgi:hypothetical protein
VGAKAEIAAEILPRDWMKLGKSKNIKIFAKKDCGYTDPQSG